MGKRSTFENLNDKDFWPTPPEAVQPLLKALGTEKGITFIEPCAGDRALADVLTEAGHTCLGASDIEPASDRVVRCDALDIPFPANAVLITNPPFKREMLEALLRHWIGQGTVWLLLPTDTLFNLWFAPYAPYVHEIVPIGRVKWIKDSPSVGKENYTWVRFERAKRNVITQRTRGNG